MGVLHAWWIMPLQGSLGHLGLADLLQTGLTGQAEGTLTLRNGAARAALYVADDGLYLLEPDVLDSDELLRAFVTRGLISQSAVDKARKKVGSGIPLVDHLSELGAIPQGELMDVLAGTAEDTILDLLTWDRGEFRFEENTRDSEHLGLVGRVGVDPGGVMLRAAQRMDERADIAAGVGMGAALFVAMPGQPPSASEGGDPAPEVYACLDGHAVIDEVALLLGIGRFAALKAAFELVEAGAARVASATELAQAAESRANQQQYRIARMLLLQWSESAPTDPAPVRRLVRVAVSRGRMQEELDAVCWLGHLHIGLGEPAEAVRELQAGLERHPHERRLLRALRDAAEAAGDVQAFATGTIRMAEVAMKESEHETAARLLEPLVKAQPHGLSIRVLYTKALIKCNDHDGVVAEAEAVAKVLGRKCKRRDERETAGFFREAIAGVAPERTDLLRRFRGMVEVDGPRKKRVALVSSLLVLFVAAGVVLWPRSADGLLKDAQDAWSVGNRADAEQIIGDLIERYPDSAEAEAAFVLQARILNPGGATLVTVQVDRELASRVKKITPLARKAFENLPAPEAQATLNALIVMLDGADGRPLRRPTVRDLSPDVRRAVQSLTRATRSRNDVLRNAGEQPIRLKSDHIALKEYIDRAERIRQDSTSRELHKTVDLLNRFVALYEQDELIGAIRELDRVVRSLTISISSSAEPLAACRRVLVTLELKKAEGNIRKNAPALVVNGKLDAADTLYATLQTMIKDISTDAQMARIVVGLDRRRIRQWLRTKRAQIEDIRTNLSAARAAEAAGDLAAATQAYVGLIHKYEYIRFETVFSLPLRVTTVPAGAAIEVNGEPRGQSPLIVRYAWGSSTTIVANAPGYASETVLLRTADEDPDTELILRLGPEAQWTVPVESTLESRPIAVGKDVVTLERSGRITRYDFHSGKIRWARHFESLEGVRSSPVLAGSSIHMGMIDGRVIFVDPHSGNKRGEVDVGRPVGDLAVQNDIVGIATLRGEFIGLRNRAIAYRKPLTSTPHSGTVGAHGAFWVGTNDGALMRINSRDGSSRRIDLGIGRSPVTGIAAGRSGVIATTAGGAVVYVSSIGNIRWKKPDVGDLVGAGAEAGNTVFVADRRGRILFFNAGDGKATGAQDLEGSPRGGLISLGNLCVASLDSGQLWCYDAAKKAVRFDVRLGGTGRFPIGIVGNQFLVVSRDGMQLALVRVPPEPEASK